MHHVQTTYFYLTLIRLHLPWFLHILIDYITDWLRFKVCYRLVDSRWKKMFTESISFLLKNCQSVWVKAPRMKTLLQAVQMRTSLSATASRLTKSVRKIWRRKCKCLEWMTTKQKRKQRKKRVCTYRDLHGLMSQYLSCLCLKTLHDVMCWMQPFVASLFGIYISFLYMYDRHLIKIGFWKWALFWISLSRN